MLILASGSPRRAWLLRFITPDFCIKTADIDETAHINECADDYVVRLAKQKAEAVHGAWVLGADTICVLDGQILGKPKDKSDAFSMWSAMQNRTHLVKTAVCVQTPKAHYQGLASAKVHFGAISEAMMNAYWQTGEPLDKAGAYGIQGLGARFCTRVEGDYTAVMGLPVALTSALLHDSGFLRYSELS